MSIKMAVEKLRIELSKDVKLYETYHSTIACCFFDAARGRIKGSDSDLHAIANNAATGFLKLFIGDNA